MNSLDEAHEMMSAMVLEHLPYSDWQVTFDRSRIHAGICDFDRGEIRLSIPFVRSHSREEVEQVMLHEIAHAIVGLEHLGHGKVWKKTAASLGYEGGQYAESRLTRGEDQLGYAGVIATAICFSWMSLGVVAGIIVTAAALATVGGWLYTRIAPIPRRFVPPKHRYYGKRL